MRMHVPAPRRPDHRAGALYRPGRGSRQLPAPAGHAPRPGRGKRTGAEPDLGPGGTLSRHRSREGGRRQRLGHDHARLRQDVQLLHRPLRARPGAQHASWRSDPPGRTPRGGRIPGSDHARADGQQVPGRRGRLRGPAFPDGGNRRHRSHPVYLAPPGPFPGPADRGHGGFPQDLSPYAPSAAVRRVDDPVPHAQGLHPGGVPGRGPPAP